MNRARGRRADAKRGSFQRQHARLCKTLICYDLPGFRAVQVSLVQRLVSVIQRGLLTFDEEEFHIGGQFQRIAGSDDEVGYFADLQAAQLIGEAEDLRWV